jgi:hypothetical protein
MRGVQREMLTRILTVTRIVTAMETNFARI